MWKITAPTSSREVLSQRWSILPSPAMSCCTSQLAYSVVASMAWSSTAEYLQISSTSWIALREAPSICLASASWKSQHWNQFCFRLESASLVALSKSTNINIVNYWVLVCKNNAVPEAWEWQYSDSVKTLSSFFSACVSASLGTGVFMILASAHTLRFSSASLLSLVNS